MPNQPRTPLRSIRIDHDLWALAGDVATATGTDRGAVIRGFLRWYVGEEGAELPAPAERVER